MYFDRTYYLAPSSADAARRPYVLLLRAMQETGMAAVGKFVLWGKENLCLIRAQGDTLALADAVLPRRRPLEGRDRGVGGERRAEEARARAGAAR